MLELLSPAGSLDALRAAVCNGADAVYFGSENFNARRGAKNFTLDELPETVRYCHVRGVKVYLTLNTLVSDREMRTAAETIKTAARAGVDALSSRTSALSPCAARLRRRCRCTPPPR